MFFDSMKDLLNEEKTFTTNGAVAYRTSGKQLLDFNFCVSALRNKSENEIEDKYAKVFYEDRLTAIKYLFYVGDVRGGLGERKTFKTGLKWLSLEHPEIAKAVLPLVAEYTRWDNLWCLLDSVLRYDIVDLIKTQLNEDEKNMMENKPISLLAKWMPSINASSSNTRRIARVLCKEIGITKAQYREMLSQLRKYLDVVEVKMSAKEWDKIKYESVPSKANLNYNSAFLRNDEKRRRAYLDALSKGETKINASTLQPHEITYKYRRSRSVDETLEELWKALPNLFIENTLVIRDGSASMTWTRCGNSGATPLDVATALAIYMSEHNSGGWKDKFVTFSASPKIVDLSKCKTLREKVDLSLRESDCSNTNIYKTMKLILNTAIRNKMTQEDMPKTIVITSDMQFDGRYHSLNKSLFDSIAEEYKENGYLLPKICFWNLSGSVNNTVPMQQNTLGLILCSSFSVQILKMFMSGKTDPYEILLEELNSERYRPVEEAVKNII